MYANIQLFIQTARKPHGFMLLYTEHTYCTHAVFTVHLKKRKMRKRKRKKKCRLPLNSEKTNKTTTTTTTNQPTTTTAKSNIMLNKTKQEQSNHAAKIHPNQRPQPDAKDSLCD